MKCLDIFGLNSDYLDKYRKNNMEKCVNCNSTLNRFIQDWLFKCDNCGLESSLLYDEKINGADPIGWTESASDFLESLRENNARVILKELSRHTRLESKRLLDIGCAAGWFLDVAKDNQMKVVGVEPEENIAKKGIEKNLDIKIAMFPDESLSNDKFDVITFNDVFEHINNPDDMLKQVHSQLDNEGYLILNLPSSDGVFYKISCVLAKIGYASPLERLWQKGYFSPHLYYFSNQNLSRFVEKNGFELLSRNRLDVIQVSGLWNRINHNKAMSLPVASIVYFSIILIFPLLKYLLPSDIMFHVYKKRSN
jgi:2-polyprenyl-3-methyl-5-hydroxy-6-metoxy-1,4-benzoquinol methylase